MILGFQAPIRGIGQKHTKDATQLHRISNPASHLRRESTKQGKPTNEAPAPTYTQEGPLTSHPAKDGGQRRLCGAGRTPGSAEPGWVPGPLSLGRKVATALLKSVASIPALISPGNRPLHNIKGASTHPLLAFIHPITYTRRRSSSRTPLVSLE